MNANTIVTILGIILISAISLYSQTDSDFPSIEKQDIPDVVISKSSYFDDDGLWGYINGGADLYLEYGFDKLLFQDIEFRNHNFRVEYYRMKNSESAFGIYSTSIFKCLKRDTISKYVCISPYQVQSALGRFYISIANNKGTKEASALTVELFSIINKKSVEQLYEIPKLVSENFSEDARLYIKLVKGILGLQNGSPKLSGLFEKSDKYTLYQNPASLISLVSFNSTADLENFVEQNKSLFAQNYKIKIITEKDLLIEEL
jgi:hypothetical protein